MDQIRIASSSRQQVFHPHSGDGGKIKKWLAFPDLESTTKLSSLHDTSSSDASGSGREFGQSPDIISLPVIPSSIHTVSDLGSGKRSLETNQVDDNEVRRTKQQKISIPEPTFSCGFSMKASSRFK